MLRKNKTTTLLASKMVWYAGSTCGVVDRWWTWLLAPDPCWASPPVPSPIVGIVVVDHLCHVITMSSSLFPLPSYKQLYVGVGWVYLSSPPSLLLALVSFPSPTVSITSQQGGGGIPHPHSPIIHWWHQRSYWLVILFPHSGVGVHNTMFTVPCWVSCHLRALLWPKYLSPT